MPLLATSREKIEATPLAYSPGDAAALIGISRAGLYKLLADGTLPSISIGRRRLIRHDALVAMLEELEDRVGDGA